MQTAVPSTAIITSASVHGSTEIASKDFGSVIHRKSLFPPQEQAEQNRGILLTRKDGKSKNRAFDTLQQERQISTMFEEIPEDLRFNKATRQQSLRQPSVAKGDYKASFKKYIDINKVIAEQAISRRCPGKFGSKFIQILESPDFDAFVLSAANYARWHVQILHLEKMKLFQPLLGSTAATADENNASAGDLEFSQTAAASRKDTNLDNNQSGKKIVGQSSNNSVLGGIMRGHVRHVFAEDGGGTVTLEEAEKNLASELHKFATAYCYLLLLISRHSVEPAKERAYFESIYAVTKDVSNALINLPTYSNPIELELNRMFRGALFCGTLSQESRVGGIQNTAPKKRISIIAVSKDLWGSNIGTPSSILSPSRPLSARRPVSAFNSVISVATVATGSTSRPSIAFTTVQNFPIGSNAAASSRSDPLPKQKFKGKISACLSKSVDSATGAAGHINTNDANAAAALAVASTTATTATANTSFEESMKIITQQKTVLPPMTSAKKKKRISLTDIRMARSPLANAVLPPPQRFLFS
ncbi:hypothetical protein HK100_012954 [Physocladia obscura]|uniref:Uncharacterized protein n=1 Tax=Physocladia obscura TaxID=109957 RepID=A0AAD5T0F0_9FUNG|nr:hypothetical protein HK100_012954 [Physocladia obscura]